MKMDCIVEIPKILEKSSIRRKRIKRKERGK